MHVAKMQSDREYKKAFEGSKTKYNLPKDMIDVTHAKKAQDMISDLGYKQRFHHYTMPPDAVSFALARNRNDLLSDVSCRVFSGYKNGVVSVRRTYN